MNPVVKEAWVAALRSGEYKQAVGLLHNQDTGGFCCLGVLCDLHRKIHGGEWNKRSDLIPATGYYLNCRMSLPSEVIGWAGLINTGCNVAVPGIEKTLSGLNDSGSSFAEIADIIERCL